MIDSVKIFSILGNNSSLIPLGVKDSANCIGMTTGAYITGNKTEGKDRFIDELGSQFIWLGGIPFYKKVLDFVVYKPIKYNPNIDIRILNKEKIWKKAIEHAPTEEIAKSIEKAAEKINLFNGLALTKFIISTALTLASYWGLTKFRHKHTENTIIKEIKKEETNKKTQEIFFNGKNTTFEKIKQNQTPSFGMNLEMLKDFMFDPVKNTMIIDGGITAERLGESRNPQDFLGYVIKEGGFWAFMYFLGPAVQKGLEKLADKKGMPIDLDIRVLQNQDFQQALKKEGNIQEHLTAFLTTGKDEEIYESLFKKGTKSTISDNLIVQMAHESGIIKTIKGTQDIDTQQYIDIKALKEIKEKIAKLHKRMLENGNSKEFLEKLIKLKKASIIKNILTSIGALGLIVPGVMVAMRFMNKDNKDFQVKKEIHEKIKNNQSQLV